MKKTKIIIIIIQNMKKSFIMLNQIKLSYIDEIANVAFSLYQITLMMSLFEHIKCFVREKKKRDRER